MRNITKILPRPELLSLAVNFYGWGILAGIIAPGKVAAVTFIYNFVLGCTSEHNRLKNKSVLSGGVCEGVCKVLWIRARDAQTGMKQFTGIKQTLRGN